MFGLTFLNPLFFWGLTAASLPVIIHLIKRNRAVKLPFAAIRFLQVEPNERVRSQRLKQIILLLLRIIALALLALAFARPFLSNDSAGMIWGNDPRAAVVLVDRSFSMEAGTTRQQAVNEARTIVTSFKPGDEVTVMQFGETSQMLGQAKAGFSELADKTTGKVKTSLQSTNYLQALQRAEAVLMESRLRQKQIFLISDFQESGWQALNPHWKLEPGIDVNFIPVTPDDSELTNVSIQDVHIDRPGARGKAVEFLVKVKNTGPAGTKVKVGLTLEGKKVNQRIQQVPAGTEKVIRFRRVALPAGNVSGTVEAAVDVDDITVDNEYYFVVAGHAKSSILAVNGEPKADVTRDELFFVERAVNLPKLAKYALTRTTSQELDGFDFSNYRAIILANIKGLSRQSVQRLAFYVRGGGGLLITLGDQVNANIFNSLFQELSPANLNNHAFQAVSGESSVLIAQIEYQNPIFRIFSDPGQSDPSIAQFHQYFHVAPVSEQAVLARFDDGSPAILERQVGDGTVVLWTSSIDTEWNDLPVKALFLPLLYQTLDYVAAEQKGQQSYLIGNPVAVGGYGIRANQAFSVSVPSGRDFAGQDPLFTRTDEAGIYHVRDADKKTAGFFAVNVDARESDLTFTTPDRLQAIAAQVANSETLTDALASENLEMQFEKDQKLWRFAILMVVLLLVAETWLANRTYR